MEDEERPVDRAILNALVELGQKLDTVAGAVASIARTHHDLLDHAAEAEARRGQDTTTAARRLDAIERQVLALGQPPAAPAPSPGPPLEAQLGELGDDVTRRLADHTDAALAGVLRLLDVRLAMLRQALTDGDAVGGGQGLRSGFEAGAVMGAAQAAWTHLEQRLEAEFDDLGRQLQAMASVIETVAASTEDLANRPMTSDQIRKAATAARDAVVTANRSRRDRRGGPKSLGS